MDRRRLTINPLRLLDSKEEAIQPLLDAAPHSADYLCDECASHLATLRRLSGRARNAHTINFRLVRGLDDLPKTVFEVWAEGIGAQAVAAAAADDGLIEELGGAPTPGIGFADGHRAHHYGAAAAGDRAAGTARAAHPGVAAGSGRVGCLRSG